VIDDEDDELDELPLFQASASAGLTADIGVLRRKNRWRHALQRLEGDGAECALSAQRTWRI